MTDRGGAGTGWARLTVVFGLAVLVAAQQGRAASALCVGDCDTNGEVTVDELVRGVNIELGALPLSQCVAFETNADGSTKRMFVQISELHGFAVVDFATRKETSRIVLPDVPGAHKNTEGVQGSPSHGIGITPDGKVLWATRKWYGYVFA